MDVEFSILNMVISFGLVERFRGDIERVSLQQTIAGWTFSVLNASIGNFKHRGT